MKTFQRPLLVCVYSTIYTTNLWSQPFNKPVLVAMNGIDIFKYYMPKINYKGIYLIYSNNGIVTNE